MIDEVAAPPRPARTAPVAPPTADGPIPALADTPMWLSHHWPADYERCAVIGGRHVCRRCLVLYPLAIVAAVVLGAGLAWPGWLDPWVLWLLPIPAVLELTAEQLGLLGGYSARRQIAVTLPHAVACGGLYLRYLDDRTDPLVWSVIVTYGTILVLAVLWRSFHPPR